MGGDDELCALGVGAAVVQWHQHGCHTDKRAETGGNSEGGVRVFSITIYGFVLIAETASADKQMSLGGVVIITI